jgi:hypothetical protein
MCVSVVMGRNSEGIKKTRKIITNIILRIPQETRKFLALIDCATEENFIS